MTKPRLVVRAGLVLDSYAQLVPGLCTGEPERANLPIRKLQGSGASGAVSVWSCYDSTRNCRSRASILGHQMMGHDTGPDYDAVNREDRRCGMATTTLERRLYEIRDAAAMLALPPSTMRYWLEGDAEHDPVLREQPRGDSTVSWGEFVEAGLLRAYRAKRVSLQHLRLVIERLRAEFDTPYPLATTKPFIAANRRLVLDAQQAAGLAEEDGLVWEVTSGQTMLRDSIKDYLETVDFDEDEHALRMYPAGRQSPVVIDPNRSFGDTTIHGVRTEVLREQVEAGEAIEQVSEDFDLSPAQVKAALAWEWQQAA